VREETARQVRLEPQSSRVSETPNEEEVDGEVYRSWSMASKAPDMSRR